MNKCEVNYGLHYLIAACLIGRFAYELPFCANMAIGMCIGLFISCTVTFFQDWKRTTKEIKELENQSKLLDSFMEYIKNKQYDSKIPDSNGCHEQVNPSAE